MAWLRALTRDTMVMRFTVVFAVGLLHSADAMPLTSTTVVKCKVLCCNLCSVWP